MTLGRVWAQTTCPPIHATRSGLIQGVSELKEQAEQPLATEQADAHGVNVEGLAVKNGQLYIGFRGPVRDGTAYVLRVAVDPLFDGAPADPKLLPVELGQGLGVRDLATVADGLLVLAGPEADQGAAPAVFFWDGAGPSRTPWANFGRTCRPTPSPRVSSS